MKLSDLFSHSEIQLPLKRGNQDIATHIEQRLARYQSLLSELEACSVKDRLSDRTKDIEICCNGLIVAARESLEGRTPEAYKAFDMAIRKVRDVVEKKAVSLSTEHLALMYRVRRTLTPNLTKEELFHIPFEKRHEVQSHRYSIPGLPCLYLCGSLYACWEELGRPPLHELQVAALWIKPGRQLKVLDFSTRPSSLLESTQCQGAVVGQEAIDSELFHHLVLWPLLSVCSIAVTYRDSPFKPEYVLPQMALQWVLKHKAIDGICYSSTRVRQTPKHRVLSGCSLVFPAKIISASGRCQHLCDAFLMTNPISWELLRAASSSGYLGDNSCDLAVIDGISRPYSRTEFGQLETTLRHIFWEMEAAGSQVSGEISASTPVVVD